MASIRILIIDDEIQICRNCVKILASVSDDVHYALNGYDALNLMKSRPMDIVITDLKMARLGGMEVLRQVKRFYPDTIVIVMTGYASVSSAVEVMKLGAFDYLPKPFTPHELRSVVTQAIEKHRQSIQNKSNTNQKSDKPIHRSHQLIGKSHEMKKVIEMVRKVAPTDATVLLFGESGTGKELIARAVHANSLRADNVFFAVDCGTLSGNLLESELFGYVKGAFTGADQDKKGIFASAHGGTVFLDEISNISLDVQGKLLRFLETRELLPLGSTKAQKVDVRLIFATNKNLSEMVDQGLFREDFYYRIYVYPIHLPPLRQRRQDILPIAQHFLAQFAKSMNRKVTRFDKEAQERLLSYEWPGNVRQLRNVIERAVILSEHESITLKDLPIFDEIGEMEQLIDHIPANREELKRLKKKVREKAAARVEKNFVLNALKNSDWNVTQAAKNTGFQRTNLQALMKKHGITRPTNK